MNTPLHRMVERLRELGEGQLGRVKTYAVMREEFEELIDEILAANNTQRYGRRYEFVEVHGCKIVPIDLEYL